jgi:hypothetical protein
LLDAEQAKTIGKSFPQYQMERLTSFLEAVKTSEKLAKISISGVARRPPFVMYFFYKYGGSL